MEDFLQDMSTNYIVAQMSRRITYQILNIDDSEISYRRLANSGFRLIPKEWLVVGDEWCDDHDINPIHGALALMHLQSLFGTDFGEVELRVILDEAYERAKSAKWYQ